MFIETSLYGYMIRFLFSDKYRAIKIGVSLVMILFLCIFSRVYGPRQLIYFADCVKYPDQCEGKKVLAVVGKITLITENGFTMMAQGNRILVKGKPEDIVQGKYVDVLGIFHKEGYLELTTYHLHRERAIKVYISVLPIVILFYLFIKHFWCNVV